MFKTIKALWDDDSGSGLNNINTELMMIVFGVAIVSFVLAGVFISVSGLGTSVGNSIKMVAP
ncbi:hypothetical protein [Desulforamulus reducens]|uniref:hypothetical protein n=1 Tax=Desulforamulus reducens TaxID=59610 RepID=UPI000313A6F6|nr:hypothetical protein [Desulforamulus reducens]